MEEDGSETQESSSIEPPSSTTHVGEQKGANKRIHDKIVALGHKTHPSQLQRMSNVAGSNPTGSINANLANISQSQASAPTPVTKNAPSASGILASAPSAHLGQPEHPFSPVGMGRQHLLYDVNRGDDYPVKKTEVFKRTTHSSTPIYYLDDDATRIRVLPKDLDEKGNLTPDISNQYCRAQRAIYEVQQSCLHFVLTEESAPYRNVDLDGKPIANGFKPEVHALLEEHQKQSLGDYWRVLRLRPATNSIKAKVQDME